MNPFKPQVKSVEAFQRDIEPAIIAARNELVTAENFMAYKNGYSIDHYTRDNNTLYAFHSRMFFFTELDTDHIRDTYNKHLSGDVGRNWPFPTIAIEHSSYFKEGTQANRDIASVIGGNPPS